MRRSSKRPGAPKNAPAQNIADILPMVGRMLNLDSKVKGFSILALWDRIIDPRFVGQCRAVKIRRAGNQIRLLVQASSAAVASELSFSLHQYCDKLNQFTPQTGMTIHQIDLTVG
jgi:hypothetical protein